METLFDAPPTTRHDAKTPPNSGLAADVDAGLPVELINAAGDTRLILAAYHDRPGTVRALLARHADHARSNDRGQTALAAAAFQRSAAVDHLLAAGADSLLGSPSALEVARFFEHDDVAATLASRSARSDG